MRQNRVVHFAWPFVGLGGLVAVACLASTWYINRLQSDMARAVRDDVARMEDADELQLRLRHLRFHSVMAAADPTEARKKILDEDRKQVVIALADVREGTDEDSLLIDAIEEAYRKYDEGLGLDGAPGTVARSGNDLIQWADAHHVQGLLDACRELENRQRDRMNRSLDRSQSQTTWAGRILLVLGLIGVSGGLLSGYATARGQSRRTTRLLVRVQAVQAHLDQEVGAMEVEGPRALGDLDEQLDLVVGRVKDVCQRLQEQERNLLRAEQLAAVGQLAAGVAHEVRNPLTGIKFLIEAALRPFAATPLTNEDLRLIRQEIVRMERTVQGLLDFARTPPPDRRQLDVKELIAEATGTVRARAEAKQVALRVTVPPGPVTARVDRDQFLSLVTNLLVNAIEVTPPEGRVEVCAEPANGGMIRVMVTDTGPGINPSVAGRLFTPFTTTKANGTGLGLTVARRIARDHGGTLSAANRPEGGACFTATVPAAEASHAEAGGH